MRTANPALNSNKMGVVAATGGIFFSLYAFLGAWYVWCADSLHT